MDPIDQMPVINVQMGKRQINNIWYLLFYEFGRNIPASESHTRYTWNNVFGVYRISIRYCIISAGTGGIRCFFLKGCGENCFQGWNGAFNHIFVYEYVNIEPMPNCGILLPRHIALDTLPSRHVILIRELHGATAMLVEWAGCVQLGDPPGQWRI